MRIVYAHSGFFHSSVYVSADLRLNMGVVLRTIFNHFVVFCEYDRRMEWSSHRRCSTRVVSTGFGYVGRCRGVSTSVYGGNWMLIRWFMVIYARFGVVTCLFMLLSIIIKWLVLLPLILLLTLDMLRLAFFIWYFHRYCAFIWSLHVSGPFGSNGILLLFMVMNSKAVNRESLSYWSYIWNLYWYYE